MSRFILTNNPSILTLYPSARWVDGGPDAVLLESRKMVHDSYPLLMHPFMGDIHLIQNPFRTILLGEKMGEVDPVSLAWIEESIDRLRRGFREEQSIEDNGDYQMIDFDLFQKAIQQGKS